MFDGHPPPPPLMRAWDYEHYGVDLMELPPGELPLIRTANNAYRALSSYKNASGNTAKWAEQNPDTWAWVAEVLAERRTRLQDG